MTVTNITSQTPFIPQEGSTTSSSPGILSWLSLCKSFKDSVTYLRNTIKISDHEGTAEALVRVLNLPLGIVVSLDQFITFITILLSGASVITLSPFLVTGGLIFLTVELGLELYRLIRTIIFTLKNEIKTKKKNPNEIISQMHNKYYNNDEKNQTIQINRMARIVGRDVVLEIFEKSLLTDLDHTQLLKYVNEQANKALLVHIIGLTGILLAMTTLVLAFLSFPILPLITIGVIGLTIEFARYFAPRAFIDQRGYTFRLLNRQ